MKMKKFWHLVIMATLFLLACGGCAKKTPRSTEKKGLNQGVLLEYVGPSTTTMTFLGQVTRTPYRFGNNSGHKQRYVYVQDAPALLDLGQFKEIKPEPVKVREYQTETNEAQVIVQADVQPEVIQPEVKEEAKETLSIKKLEKAIPSIPKEELAVMLAQEKAGLARKTAIEMLEKALKADQ